MNSDELNQLPPIVKRSTMNHDGERESYKGIKLAVIIAKFNIAIGQRLLNGVLSACDDKNVSMDDVSCYWVPGAFEIPMLAAKLAACKEFDAIICLGAVIRGDTPHFDFVAGEAARGIQEVAIQSKLPVIFGVLTTDTIDQAMERCQDGPHNKGYEAAITAMEMTQL